MISLWVVWLFCDQASTTILNIYSGELFPTSYRAAAASARLVAGTAGGALGLLLEALLYGVVGSHWAAIRYLMCFPLAAATVMYALFPETSGCELEQIAPEA